MKHLNRVRVERKFVQVEDACSTWSNQTTGGNEWPASRRLLFILVRQKESQAVARVASVALFTVFKFCCNMKKMTPIWKYKRQLSKGKSVGLWVLPLLVSSLWALVTHLDKMSTWNCLQYGKDIQDPWNHFGKRNLEADNICGSIIYLFLLMFANHL